MEFPKPSVTQRVDEDRQTAASSGGCWVRSPRPEGPPTRAPAAPVPCLWRSHLVHCTEGSRAQHLDLFEFCFLQDPQQSLVGSFSAGCKGLNQLWRQRGRVMLSQPPHSTPRVRCVSGVSRHSHVWWCLSTQNSPCPLRRRSRPLL